MRIKFVISGLIVGALLVPVVGFSEDKDSDRDHPKAFVKDSAITVAIKSKLALESLSSLATISVDTDADGVVWLSGTARSQAEIDKAISISRATEHVVRVHSDLTVKKED